MHPSEILIIGANGQLGKALQRKYPEADGTDSDSLDITNIQSLEAYDWSGISIILNAAAFTNVDGAETAQGRVAAWQVNAAAVANLAKIAQKHDITLVHISSDYVFDGTQEIHTEIEPYSPLSVYGASKAAGDIAASTLPKHYILRTSWVIGEGKNFVQTMLGVGQKGIEPTVVADQIGRLTFTSELVRAIDHLLSTQAPYGAYNVSNEGESASWSEITREIFKCAGFGLQVFDTTTEDYFKDKEGIAPRPLQSTLSLDKIHATGFMSHDWKEDLEHYVKAVQGAKV